MVAKTEDFDIDFFDRPIPGQSFTDAQGKNPYESQPMVTSPEQAMNLVEESLEHPAAYENILNLLDAGISSETIASALVLKMFSEGRRSGRRKRCKLCSSRRYVNRSIL